MKQTTQPGASPGKPTGIRWLRRAAGVGRIVFAAAAAEFGPILPGGPSFALTCAEVVASASVSVEVSGPHLGEEALVVFRAAARN